MELVIIVGMVIAIIFIGVIVRRSGGWDQPHGSSSKDAGSATDHHAGHNAGCGCGGDHKED